MTKHKLFYNRSMKEWWVYYRYEETGKWKSYFRVDSKEYGEAYIKAIKEESIECRSMIGLQKGCGRCPKCRYASESLSKVKL